MGEAARQAAVTAIVERLLDLELGHPARIAVDGITASGKSTLAAELASAVLYLDAVHPERAAIVVDNDVPESPSVHFR